MRCHTVGLWIEKFRIRIELCWEEELLLSSTKICSVIAIFSIPSRPPYILFVLVVTEQPLAILSGLMSVTGVGGNTGTLWEG